MEISKVFSNVFLVLAVAFFSSLYGMLLPVYDTFTIITICYSSTIVTVHPVLTLNSYFNFFFFLHYVYVYIYTHIYIFIYLYNPKSSVCRWYVCVCVCVFHFFFSKGPGPLLSIPLTSHTPFLASRFSLARSGITKFVNATTNVSISHFSRNYSNSNSRSKDDLSSVLVNVKITTLRNEKFAKDLMVHQLGD